MSDSRKPGEEHQPECECLLCDSRRVLVETGIDRGKAGEAVAEPSREPLHDQANRIVAGLKSNILSKGGRGIYAVVYPLLERAEAAEARVAALEETGIVVLNRYEAETAGLREQMLALEKERDELAARCDAISEANTEVLLKAVAKAEKEASGLREALRQVIDESCAECESLDIAAEALAEANPPVPNEG